jgi:hypothetical protein
MGQAEASALALTEPVRELRLEKRYPMEYKSCVRYQVCRKFGT